MVLFLAEVKFFSFWLKTMDYNEVILCGPFYSTVEGATELKFAPIGSS